MEEDLTDTSDAHRSGCPLSVFLEMFGDRWSLLVVRDLLFGDKHEFGDFLSAEEGIATNVLADRLRRLTRSGVIDKRPHPSDARKLVYNLTEKGVALAPILMEMVLWSADHEHVRIPEELRRRMTQDRERLMSYLRARASQARG
jgi:DNA-binding HxlR family transcriptional regulator